MSISGLVVTLVDDSSAREASLAAMRDHPALEIGDLAGGRVPVVVESVDADEDRLVWEWLHSLPGVALVVVAFVSFDAESPPADSASGREFLQDASLLSVDRRP